MQLRFDRLCKQFGDVTAFNIPSLVIEPGEFFTFAGPQASGKTTLIQVLAGLESATSGALYADGRVLNDVPADDRGIRRVELDTLLTAGSSPCVVCDEPLAGVSTSERDTAVETLKRVHREHGATLIYATADQSEVRELSDRVALLHGGVVQQIGSPDELVAHPRTIAVAGFFGDPPMNVVPGILEKDGVAVEIGPRAVQLSGLIEATYARDVFLGVRPENIRIAPDPQSGWRATITRVEPRADDTILRLRVDGGEFVARENGPSRFAVGDRVAISMAAKHLHVFDEKGVRLDIV